MQITCKNSFIKAITQKPSVTSGFTLVELAIVIVIIGLLVGGVLQGQELVSQAEIRSSVKYLQEIQSARQTFYAKYNGYPGDLTNGLTFFPATGNGNGNGYVDINPPSISPTEITWVWNQLANSKIFSTNYNGVANSTTTSPYADSPIGKKNAALSAVCGVCGTYHSLKFASGVFNTGDMITMAPNNITAGGYLYEGFLTVDTTYGIDVKIDDGKPSTGNFYGLDGMVDESTTAWLDCATPTGGSDTNHYGDQQIDYNFAETAKACRIAYKL